MSFRPPAFARALAVSVAIAATTAIAPAAHAVPPPAAPFTQCPAIGLDTSCEVLIWIDPTGVVNVLHDPLQGPYDGSEDTLVGVQNDSPFTVTSLYLTSPTLPIFGFDGDGLCVAAGAPAACPFGPTNYEGPGTGFVNVSADKRSGTVMFGPPGPGAPCVGLPPLASTYFSLEEDLSAGGVFGGVRGTGRAYGLGVTLAPSPETTVADTGTVSTETHVSALTTPPNPVASASVLSGDVTFGAGSPDVTADAATARALVTVPGVVTVTANALHAWSHTFCNAAGVRTSTGDSNIADLEVSSPYGPPLSVSMQEPANTTFTVGPATIVVNEQTPTPFGLLVRALHVTVPSLGIDVVVSSAETDG